jgi:hypothetical protein
LLVYPADRIVEIQEAGKLGIQARIEAVDFAGIMERMRHIVQHDHDQMREGLRETQEIDFYEGMAHFTNRYALQVGEKRLRAKKIFVANGARPLIPPIRGLDQVPYLTNESVLQLSALPASMAIIGGGYIACEFAHFFAAMGTHVTILQRNERLVPEEEPEISDLLKKKLSERMEVHTGAETHLWSPEMGRYVRMINQQEDGHWDVDPVLDASVVGLWLFGMLAPDDARIVATMQAIRDRLWVKTPVGGVARYETDYYHRISEDIENVPGNPWFICTLWLAQWHIATAQTMEDLKPALDILSWAQAHTLSSGVMAEQVHPYTNAPLSVSPLTWSHATLVMTVREYLARQAQLKATTL